MRKSLLACCKYLANCFAYSDFIRNFAAKNIALMIIEVENIKNGLPGVAPVTAAHLYESFMCCMHYHSHNETTLLSLSGYEQPVTLKWRDYYDAQISRTYTDEQYNTEHGAVCLSIMLTLSLTPYTVIMRSRKGTGFDYWLGIKDTVLFQKKARLEASGILKGDDRLMDKRYKAKSLQTQKSDDSGLPAYISIVEFSRPKAIFKKKEL